MLTSIRKLVCLEEIGEKPGAIGTDQRSKYKQILSKKIVHLLAFFSLVYVGVEISIGGNIISNERIRNVLIYIALKAGL